jgi:tetratricopeptide (TPR) repeat protein
MDSVLNLLSKEKNDSIKVGYMMWIAQRKMGSAQNTGNWNEAIDWWKKALRLSIQTNNEFCIGRCNMFLGIAYKQKGDQAEALKYYYDALNISFKTNNKRQRTAAYSNIGDCYKDLGKYDEALKNYTSAYENQQSINDGVPLDIRQIAVAIALIYTKLQNWEQALKWYHKTLPYDSLVFYEGWHEILLASIQMGMGNYDEALKSYRAAAQVIPQRFNRKEELNYKGIVGLWYLDLGEAYFRIGGLTNDNERKTSFTESINYLTKSLPLLTEGAGGKEALMNAYDLLKQSSEALNDYQNALTYTKQYSNIKDSIYNKTTYLKMADLKVKYETEKAAAELKGKQELEKARNEKLLADQKLEQEKIFADERVSNAKVTAEQKLEQEKATAIAGEKANYEKSIAVEKIRNEKQQTNNLLLMGLILVVVTSVFLILYFRQRHEKKRAVEKLETIHQMAELEMQSLRSQLNPHFMFNSLNSIQTMIMKEETDKSQSYLSRFARLLRMLLENADKPFIPLRMEMEFLQLYLSLEVLRVPDMQYSISTDPELNTEQILIPNMILQPYVENAIWHGLSHKEADKQLRIRVFRENGTINYEIEDNGVGRKKAGELKSLLRKQHQSKGMKLISKRIELLNKEYSSVIQTEVNDVMKNKEVAGTLVSIKVPLTLSEHSQN